MFHHLYNSSLYTRRIMAIPGSYRNTIAIHYQIEDHPRRDSIAVILDFDFLIHPNEPQGIKVGDFDFTSRTTFSGMIYSGEHKIRNVSAYGRALMEASSIIFDVENLVKKGAGFHEIADGLLTKNMPLSSFKQVLADGMTLDMVKLNDTLVIVNGAAWASADLATQHYAKQFPTIDLKEREAEESEVNYYNFRQLAYGIPIVGQS
ncbi:hypothetical protein ACI2KR_30490 [Pseudomonas luteola]